MDYYVTKFTINANDEQLRQATRELLADMIADAGYESFMDTDEGMEAYVQTTELNREMVDQLLQEFPITEVSISYVTEPVESEDWNAVWEAEGFEPIKVGDRCVIYDAKSPDATTLAESAEVAIAIDAQMAFGTGTHETTQMLVTELLENNVKGKRVLDCGCGTGILSLVAKRCGAEHVTAYDIDDWSVRNTHHNAEINGIILADVLLGDVSVLSHVDGMFDVIMANINRNVLLADMEAMIETLAPNGVVLLSGFYEEDATMLLSKASTLGLYEASRRTLGGWCMLCLHR